MSRPLKFRAWHYASKKILSHPYSVEYFTEGVPINDLFSEEDQAAGGYTLMQYTGLKDKNGVEIYEGDIVRGHSGELVPVVFHDGAFCVQYPGLVTDLMRYQTLRVYHISAVVVGNIYENPELLEAAS